MIIPSPKVDQKRGKTSEVEGDNYREEDSKDEGREGTKDSILEGKQMKKDNFFSNEEEGKKNGRGEGKNPKEKVAEEMREKDVLERKEKINTSSAFHPHISKIIPDEEAVMEAISYQNRDTVDVDSHSRGGGYGNDGLETVGKIELDRDQGSWDMMTKSPLETNEIEKNPVPFVTRYCCPSVRTQIHPKGTVIFSLLYVIQLFFYFLST